MNCLAKLLLALPAFAANSATAKPATSERPNIVLIYADDLGMGMLGHKGQKIVSTPNIDKLAAEGMSFSNYYGNTYCAPARWSLITGMHDGRKGSGSHTKGGFIVNLDKENLPAAEWKKRYDAHIAAREKAVPHPKNEVFLGQVAQQAGYKTAQFGKLDIGFLTWHERITRHGWDHYVGYYDHQRAHGFYPTYLWKNGEKLPLKGNTSPTAGKRSEKGNEPVGTAGTTYSQEVLLKEMLSFMRDNKDQRFFLYHPTQLPHGPVAVNKLHADYADRKDLTLSEKKYATMVKMLDDHVGALMSELNALGLDEKTVVFFTSDNGHETYYYNKDNRAPKRDYRRLLKADGTKANLTDNKWRTNNGGDSFNGAAGMSGLKWCAFEGGIHCPMIARWPNKIKAGSTTNHLATHYDFMATLASLAGTKSPANKDTRSYHAALLGQPVESPHEWIFINCTGSTSNSTLITKDGWKLLQLKDKSFQLYSTKNDHLEAEELSAKHPEIVEKLKPIFMQQLNSERPDLK